MSKNIKVAINGFGRIGRSLFRLLLEQDQIEVVAINDLADARTLSHLLKYDSIHGVLKRNVSYSNKGILVDEKLYPLRNFSSPLLARWNDIDIVIESSGKFKNTSDLENHLQNGAQKVILTVPPKEDNIKTVVMGVNESILDGSETIISNASCTTNNAAPMIKIIDELCGVEQAYITTVHSY